MNDNFGGRYRACAEQGQTQEGTRNLTQEAKSIPVSD